MRGLPGDSVALIVTSPPYPMIEMWDQTFCAQDPRIGEQLTTGDGPPAYESMHRLLDAVWAECQRVLLPGGFACINIGDATRTLGSGFRLYTNHSRITVACEALGMQSLPAVLWRKQTNAPNKFMGSGVLPSGAYVTLEHEYILILRKGDKRVFGEPDKKRRARSAFFWEERNCWFSDIWDFKGIQQRLTQNQARKRSGAFPFELAFRLINMYSMQEDLVLDPFAGTATTTIAAMAAGRNSLALEIDRALLPLVEETIAEAVPRLNQRQQQRLQNHHSFVREYRESRGADPGHRNTAHGFPVVTRAEVDLVIPAVSRVRREGEGRYAVEHDPQNERETRIATEGVAAPAGSAGQLDLWSAE